MCPGSQQEARQLGQQKSLMETLSNYNQLSSAAYWIIKWPQFSPFLWNPPWIQERQTGAETAETLTWLNFLSVVTVQRVWEVIFRLGVKGHMFRASSACRICLYGAMPQRLQSVKAACPLADWIHRATNQNTQGRIWPPTLEDLSRLFYPTMQQAVVEKRLVTYAHVCLLLWKIQEFKQWHLSFVFIHSHKFTH